jgi:hypothetical protein
LSGATNVTARARGVEILDQTTETLENRAATLPSHSIPPGLLARMGGDVQIGALQGGGGLTARPR